MEAAQVEEHSFRQNDILIMKNNFLDKMTTKKRNGMTFPSEKTWRWTYLLTSLAYAVSTTALPDSAPTYPVSTANFSSSAEAFIFSSPTKKFIKENKLIIIPP